MKQNDEKTYEGTLMTDFGLNNWLILAQNVPKQAFRVHNCPILAPKLSKVAFGINNCNCSPKALSKQ